MLALCWFRGVHLAETGRECCAHADLLQRLGDAEALVTELRSRILGLTALNADLTRQLHAGADEAAALSAAEARSRELEAQLAAAAKEIPGLQVLWGRHPLHAAISCAFESPTAHLPETQQVEERALPGIPPDAMLLHTQKPAGFFQGGPPNQPDAGHATSQADLALAERVERRLMHRAADAEAAREDVEAVLARGGPTGRAQVPAGFCAGQRPDSGAFLRCGCTGCT